MKESRIITVWMPEHYTAVTTVNHSYVYSLPEKRAVEISFTVFGLHQMKVWFNYSRICPKERCGRKKHANCMINTFKLKRGLVYSDCILHLLTVLHCSLAPWGAVQASDTNEYVGTRYLFKQSTYCSSEPMLSEE